MRLSRVETALEDTCVKGLVCSMLSLLLNDISWQDIDA